MIEESKAPQTVPWYQGSNRPGIVWFACLWNAFFFWHFFSYVARGYCGRRLLCVSVFLE